MELPASSAAPAIGPPDWSNIDSEVLCPLCDYNLRGLVEPRCPECGHHSNWDELLDYDRREHPWLFENKGRSRSFFRTLAVSQFPRRFWTTVLPTHTVRVRRLLLYWMLSAFVMSLPILVARGWQLAQFYKGQYEARQRIISEIARGSAPYKQMARGYSSAEAAAAAMIPYVTPWEVYSNIAQWSPDYLKIAADVAMALILWPWLTVLTLMIFQRTMRKARIKLSHVVRCAIYANDAALPLLIGSTVILPGFVAQSARYYSLNGQSMFFAWPALFILLLGTVVMTYRLAVAYKLYLRFPHAVATSAAVQFIVLLALLAISSWGFLY